MTKPILPPLPDGNAVGDGFYDDTHMEAYALAAYQAGRDARGADWAAALRETIHVYSESAPALDALDYLLSTMEANDRRAKGGQS